MAAGKHGGYRDDEYRTDFGMSKKENGYRKRGRRRRECERGSVRKRNIREREVMNGGYGRSSRGGGGRRRRRCEAAVGAMDTEPSKLVSDAAIDQLSTKKRKFSPIVWDRDDREISRFIKSRSFLDTDSYSQSPGLVKSYRHENVQTSGAYDGEISPEASPDLSSEFRAETDGYVPVPSLISCRWAKDAESPADEGEISDCEHMAKLRRKSSSELGKVRGCSGSISLEVEVEREGSEGTWGKSLRSDICGRSSSRDTYCDNDHNNDSVEIDDDHSNQGGASVIVSETESDDDSRSLGTQEPAQAPQRSINILQGCRSVDGFEKLAKVGEGTYGIVYRARDKKTGEIVALKKIKMLNGRQGIPLTSLREITILLSLHHPSIVDLKKVIMGSRLDSILMVMEYMEHDLKALLETMKQPFSQSEVKCLMLQLLEGVECLHDNFVLHRDLKTSNLLLNNRGELKICDFGLARKYGNPLRPYTQMVVTLWYRAPELLLGAKEYSTAIDMWSVGCIMAELLSKEPLFNGKTELDQLGKIFRILGTPNETIWPGISKLLGVKANFVKHKFPALDHAGQALYNLLRRKFPAMSFTGALLSDAGFDLLNKLLTYDPEKRITAKEALNHEWFREVPLPKSKEFMPTFPAPCTR